MKQSESGKFRKASLVEPVVEVRYELSCAICHGRLRRLSLDGVFIEADGIAPVGTRLEVVLSAPELLGKRDPLRVPAVVQWTERKGFGAKFGLLGAHQTSALTQLMDRWLPDDSSDVGT